MPLPKISTPTYELELPSTGQTIKYRPFLVREEKLLVDRQWQSIENGLKLERDSVKYLLTKLKSASITFYPHGSKMDRWYGIDVTINGINCQVKPLTSYFEKDGVYTVYTYGMRDYSSKKMVNKIIFANNKEILIFDNKNYSVNSRSKATFNEQPKIVK